MNNGPRVFSQAEIEALRDARTGRTNPDQRLIVLISILPNARATQKMDDANKIIHALEPSSRLVRSQARATIPRCHGIAFGGKLDADLSGVENHVSG